MSWFSDAGLVIKWWEAGGVRRGVLRSVPRILVALVLGAGVFGGTAWGESRPVGEELAIMVEEVVTETGISINISESTDTSVNISHVNGRSVCDPESRSDVERLQRAFDAHPNIYRNIGPALITFTYRDGRKFVADRKGLEREGALKGCTNIYVSVHE